MANVLFDLIDRDYDHCLREEYPRQIKTRRSSFQSILQKFTNFRLKWLESRLDKLKDKALTDGYTEKNFKKKSEKKIMSMFEKGTTVLFVSHNEDQVRRLCTKGILLDHGKLVFSGTAGEAMDRYLNKV